MVLFIIGIALTWYFGGGTWLSYLVLFMGCNSALYSVFDIIGDLISRRIQESDAYQLSLLYCHSPTLCPPELVGFFWLLFSLFCMTGSVFLGLRLFRKVEAPTMNSPSNSILPIHSNSSERSYIPLEDGSMELENLFTQPTNLTPR